MDSIANDQQRIADAVTALGEHFDSVQILATRYESNDKTLSFQVGVGNWYARFGLVREWLIREEERTRLQQRNLDS